MKKTQLQMKRKTKAPASKKSAAMKKTQLQMKRKTKAPASKKSAAWVLPIVIVLTGALLIWFSFSVINSKNTNYTLTLEIEPAYDENENNETQSKIYPGVTNITATCIDNQNLVYINYTYSESWDNNIYRLNIDLTFPHGGDIGNASAWRLDIDFNITITNYTLTVNNMDQNNVNSPILSVETANNRITVYGRYGGRWHVVIQTPIPARRNENDR